MKPQALIEALNSSSDGATVASALRALDPDDTRVGERLWAALRADPTRVAQVPPAWRFLAQAPRGAFTAADLNIFFRELSQASVPRFDPEQARLPWDPSFDALLSKVADDVGRATLDTDVQAPMLTALRVAMVRHGFAEPHTWGSATAHDWLELLLPVWDRYPGYADEFTRFWPTQRHGSLAVRVASDPHTALQTTDFLDIYSTYAHPEERLRIVLNITSPHAMERALAVLEDGYRDNLTVLFGTESKWWERVFDDFGSWIIGAHGFIGGPGLLGLLLGLGLFRLFEIPFSLFVLTIVSTFAVWRIVLALSVRPQLPWEACRPLASSKLSLGLVAGWIVYRRALAKKKVEPARIEDFCAGLVSAFPELGRPSRLRTVIEVNLEQLPRDQRDERVLQIFRADDSIERWAILEYSTSERVARAAIEATKRFDLDGEEASIVAAPPIAQSALRHLAAHNQQLFLDALDGHLGAEEVLVFAIGQARGDGVLDSLGRKLGQGSAAMRDAIVTALSNYGKAATGAVERALQSTETEHRRDGAEVAWRLGPSSQLATMVRTARARETVPAVARLLTCVEIGHAFARSAPIDSLDAPAMAFALDEALSELGEVVVDLEAPTGLVWQSGTPVTDSAARGLARVVTAFDGSDARLLQTVASISLNLELESRDRWALELFDSQVDTLAAIAIAGPAATLSMRSSTETIEALARMGTPAALIRLDGIAHDDPDPGLRRRAFGKLYQVAEGSGVDVFAVFERAVMRLNAEATIDPKVARIVEKQAERVLREAMIAGNRWRMEKWRELWADSPLFADLVGRFVWAIYDYGILRQTFRLDESGDPIDVNDEPVALEPFTEIGLPVPSLFDRRERDSWNVVLADYEIVAPFQQMERDIEPKDVMDLVLFGADLRSLLSSGWYPSTPGLERHYGFLRPFPRLGITASLEISPGVGDDDEQPQTIDTLAFVDGIYSEFPSISRLLKDVPVEARIQVADELWQASDS